MTGAETYSRTRWASRSHCRTREVLIRCCREHAGTIDLSVSAILAALPERIDGIHPCEAVQQRRWAKEMIKLYAKGISSRATSLTRFEIRRSHRPGSYHAKVQ
jgi:hypothetical protein